MPYLHMEALANHPPPPEVLAAQIQTIRLPLMEPSTPLDAKTLHCTFCQNWLAANERYLGYRQSVKGMVMWMGKDIHSKDSIQLSDSASGNCYVHCVLAPKQEYGYIKIGDAILVHGNYLECHPDFGVVLKYSEIIKNL